MLCISLIFSLSNLTGNSCPIGEICCQYSVNCEQCCIDEGDDWRTADINNNIKFSKNILNKLSTKTFLLNNHFKKNKFYIKTDNFINLEKY